MLPLPALIPQLCCLIAEPVLNAVIKLDPQAQARLQGLQGRQLAVVLTDLKVRLVLTAQPNGIWLNLHQEPVDCVVTTRLSSLKQLQDPSQLTRLIREEMLDIDGDLAQLQKFSQFFQQLNPDWAEHLSGYVGDAAAHRISSQISQLLQLLSLKLQQSEQQLAALALEELKLSPVGAELAQFSTEVSQLQARTEQLARRLQQLSTAKGN